MEGLPAETVGWVSCEPSSPAPELAPRATTPLPQEDHLENGVIQPALDRMSLLSHVPPTNKHKLEKHLKKKGMCGGTPQEVPLPRALKPLHPGLLSLEGELCFSESLVASHS